MAGRRSVRGRVNGVMNSAVPDQQRLARSRRATLDSAQLRRKGAPSLTRQRIQATALGA